MSGPMPKDGLRSLLLFDGRLNLSGRGPGADGVRNGASIGSLGLGKVPDRLFAPKGAGSKPSCSLWGGPKPPYPFFLCNRGGTALPALLLPDDMKELADGDVPGRSAEGLTPLE
jgi:hypothetical protein